MEEKRPIGVDLFCGVGGMSLGFEQAGFDIVAGVDSDPIHVASHLRNFPNSRTLCADISRLSGDGLRERADLGERPIDVLFGGPPCQSFSLMGHRQSDDPRSLLLFDFARLVRELRPFYFVLENVKGLLVGDALAILESFVRRVRRAGYLVVEPIRSLDASQCGVPQRRERVFVLGYLKDLPPPQYPISAIQQNGNGDDLRPTVWDAISDLPKVENHEELLVTDVYHGELGAGSDYALFLRSEIRDQLDRSRPRLSNGDGLTGCLRTKHNPKTVRRFQKTPPGTYEPVSRFYRLPKDGLCNTLRAGTDQNYGSYTAPRPIHPVYPRCVTVREAARLHSFPDWFSFHPTIWHGFRQVGNSVPPLLARAIACNVLKSLSAR